MFNLPQTLNYSYQNNPNQFMQQGIIPSPNKNPNPSILNLGSTPSSQSSMMGIPNPSNMNFSTASLSTIPSLNSPGMKNYQPSKPLMKVNN